MNWIVSFFTYITEMLLGVINFVITLANGFVTLVGMLPDMIIDMTSAVGFLPTVLTTFFGVSVTVTILFLVLGRGKGGE